MALVVSILSQVRETQIKQVTVGIDTMLKCSFKWLWVSIIANTSFFPGNALDWGCTLAFALHCAAVGKC